MSFLKDSSTENQSLVELGVMELSSGNFPKAIDLSEELIKKDFNDATGWAIKALSQAYLFDYSDKQYYLNSSISSLDEYKSKSKLASSDLIKVESLFISTLLNRTILLVQHRVEEVAELRRKAEVEKSKANAAALGAVMSAYVGSQSKTNVGKTLGYGGAVMGAAASSSFSANSDALNNISKGVFGIAVANMSMTVGYAQTLKLNINQLDNEVREEVLVVLKNWINVLAFLYREVVANLHAHVEGLKKGQILSSVYRQEIYGFIQSPEIKQFLFLSEMIGIEQTLSDYGEIKKKIVEIQSFDKSRLVIEFGKITITAFSLVLLGIILTACNIIELSTGLIIDLYGICGSILFAEVPLFKWGKLRQQVRQFSKLTNKFKVSSDRLILENMKGNQFIKN
jgi:hypothetical protein